MRHFKFFYYLLLTVMVPAISDEGMVRHPDSTFPKVEDRSDTQDILRDYLPYLRFVLEIGRSTDAATARALAQKFEALRKESPEGAARFLKGLRYEMMQKVELARLKPNQTSSHSREMREWVHRYIRLWLREADEQNFLHRTRKT